MLNDRSSAALRAAKRQVAARLALWGAAVAGASASGLLGRMPTRLAGPLIAGGIAVPALAYARSPRLKALAREVGIHKLSLFHTWRVVGTVAFLSYASKDELPAAFVRNAGYGDLMTSAFAAALAVLPRNRNTYLVFHLFGLTDFITALATGIRLTRGAEPRMKTLTTFPLALIPFFGVGVSGAAHIVALDLLREPPNETSG